MILTTPMGIAKYPYLTEPDVEFNTDGLFHTKLICKKSECIKIKWAIDDMIAKKVKEQHDKDPDKKIKIIEKQNLKKESNKKKAQEFYCNKVKDPMKCDE